MQPVTVIVDSDYAVLVERGSSAVRRMEKERYYLGELAQLVVRHYGESNLKNYAADIGMKYSTLAEYRNVSLFVQNSAARKFLDRELYPTLCYSHIRLAARIEPLPAALLFLEKCAANGLTIEQAEYIAPRKDGSIAREKIAEFESNVTLYDDFEDYAFFRIPESLRLDRSKTYLISVYEVNQE